MRQLSALLFLAILFISGCVISPRRILGGGGGGNGNGTGQLYVSNESSNSIVRFSGATQATGNIAPAATISGSSTQLSQPQYIFVDTTTNRMYVANLGAADILVFDSLSTLNGNLAPTRVISSTSLISPIDVALDSINNFLYVADKSTDSGAIVVFASASSANGSTTASRVIQPGFIPGAIFLDSGNNRLFITDPINNAVDVYDSASTLNGVVAASRTISGSNTQLSQPFGLRIDGSGRLIVGNSSSPPSISIYANAASAFGNIQPNTIISGAATTLTSPTELALDPTTNSGELYVADPVGQEVVVFSSISTATGTINATPNRQIIGSNTTLAVSGASTAIGVAIDTTR